VAADDELFPRSASRSTEVVLPVELSLLRPCVSPPGRGALVRVEVCGLAGRLMARFIRYHPSGPQGVDGGRAVAEAAFFRRSYSRGMAA
jgi:hypothetical protein